MPQVAIPFPLSSNPGRAPGEGSGRLVNCLAYADGGATRWRPMPGLRPFATVGSGPVRGGLVVSGSAIVVSGTSAYQVDMVGGQSQLEGQVPGDGLVTISRNNAPIPQVCIVSDAGAFVIENGVLKPYPGAAAASASETFTSLPSVNSVSFLDGYLLFTTSAGRIIASDLNTTDINALSFATAEARPDGLLRGIVYGSQAFFMGTDSIEVWADNALKPFPLSRTTVIPQGLFGPFAVAGYQAGWAGPLIYVAADYTVRVLDGYTPQRVSEEDLERLIAVADPASLEATVYTVGGAGIFSLSSPTWTWELNLTTGKWHERVGYDGGRWRGRVAFSAFGRWIVADKATGDLYVLDREARFDGPDPIVWGLDSGPVKDFPSRVAGASGALDFVLGDDGNPNDADPQVLISWSHDGGGRWAQPVARSLHRQGRYGGRVTVNRVGLTQAQGARWRFRVSDPAYTSFSGGVMQAEARR